MRDQRCSGFYAVRLPMISPVMAMPGQVLLYSWGGREPEEVQVLEFDHESRARVVRTGGTTAGDDMALLEEDGVIVALRTKEQLKAYGYDYDLRHGLSHARQRVRARRDWPQSTSQVTA